MEAQCEEEPQTEEADEGQLIHAAFAGKTATLTEDQESVLAIAKSLLSELRDQAATAMVLEDGLGHVIHREQTIQNDALRGTPDYAEKIGLDFLIIADLKTGRLDVPSAAENLQLAAYAVMGAGFYQAKNAFVGILQPRASRDKRLTMAFYDAEALDAAEKELERILDAAKAPDAPLNASADACRYCRAKLFCPAFKAEFSQIEKAPDTKSIATLPASDLKWFFTACKAASRISDKVMDEVRKRIENGDPEFSDMELQSTGSVRECTDIVRAFALLKEELPALDAQRFTDCTALRFGKVAELVKELSDCPKATAERAVKEILAPVVANKPKAPTPKFK